MNPQKSFFHPPLLLLLLSVFLTSCSDETVKTSVTGVVAMYDSKVPVEGIKVLIHETFPLIYNVPIDSAYTESDGRFVIELEKKVPAEWRFTIDSESLIRVNSLHLVIEEPEPDTILVAIHATLRLIFEDTGTYPGATAFVSAVHENPYYRGAGSFPTMKENRFASSQYESTQWKFFYDYNHEVILNVTVQKESEIFEERTETVSLVEGQVVSHTIRY